MKRGAASAQSGRCLHAHAGQKDATAVFDGLDDDVLVQVASRMRGESRRGDGADGPDARPRWTQMLADRARPPTDGASP